MKRLKAFLALIVVALFAVSCAGGPLTTREKGAGIGALGGAAVGGIIGSTVNHPGIGAAIGGVLGLGAGALIGDQLQGRDQQQNELERRMQEQQLELEHQRRQLNCLRNLRQNEEPGICD